MSFCIIICGPPTVPTNSKKLVKIGANRIQFGGIASIFPILTSINENQLQPNYNLKIRLVAKSIYSSLLSPSYGQKRYIIQYLKRVYLDSLQQQKFFIFHQKTALRTYFQDPARSNITCWESRWKIIIHCVHLQQKPDVRKRTKDAVQKERRI